MFEKPVVLERTKSIASIRFNRPGALNALNGASAEALLNICQQMAAAPSNRVIGRDTIVR